MFGGLELAAGVQPNHAPKEDRYVMFLTAGVSTLNMGVGYLVGLLLWYAFQWRWLKARDEILSWCLLYILVILAIFSPAPLDLPASGTCTFLSRHIAQGGTAMERPLTVGQLARATGVPAKTIRYYEQVGVLPVPRRSDAGYRHYSRYDVHRLLFIRRARP